MQRIEELSKPRSVHFEEKIVSKKPPSIFVSETVVNLARPRKPHEGFCSKSYDLSDKYLISYKSLENSLPFRNDIFQTTSRIEVSMKFMLSNRGPSKQLHLTGFQN